MHSIKIKNLQNCIDKLDLSKVAKSDIHAMISKWSHDITQENENKILSIIIFFEILAKYPDLMNHPKYKPFIKFCATEVDEMTELSLRQKPPRGR